MKKKKFPITNIGTVTLLMVFIVLCMITLAALSLSSASRDAKLNRQAVRHLTEYYEASNEAEVLLASADETFQQAYAKASDAKEYYRLINKDLLLSPMKSVWTGETLDVAIQVPINDSQALSVLLDVLPLQQVRQTNAESFYRILSWQVIRTKSWESDNTMQLIQ